MPISHYKGPWIGKTPMCAICAGAGQGERVRHHLTHGVSVAVRRAPQHRVSTAAGWAGLRRQPGGGLGRGWDNDPSARCGPTPASGPGPAGARSRAAGQLRMGGAATRGRATVRQRGTARSRHRGPAGRAHDRRQPTLVPDAPPLVHGRTVAPTPASATPIDARSRIAGPSTFRPRGRRRGGITGRSAGRPHPWTLLASPRGPA
jgi:hypothetical protein